MRWQMLVSVLITIFACAQFALAKGIKTLTLSDSDVAHVKVALGYSTLLQFDTRPAQAIVGDQDSFKVEYVGTSIAIKPLTTGVSTNLFVVTEYDKFNFKLTAGQGFEPDYILRIKKRKTETQETSSGLITRPRGVSRALGGVTLRLVSISATKSGSALIYNFELFSSDKRISFQPGDFGILQGGRSLPIENIYIEALSLERGRWLSGMILIRNENRTRKSRTHLMFHPAAIKGGLQIPVSPI